MNTRRTKHTFSCFASTPVVLFLHTTSLMNTIRTKHTFSFSFNKKNHCLTYVHYINKTTMKVNIDLITTMKEDLSYKHTVHTFTKHKKDSYSSRKTISLSQTYEIKYCPHFHRKKRFLQRALSLSFTNILYTILKIHCLKKNTTMKEILVVTSSLHIRRLYIATIMNTIYKKSFRR